MSVRVMSLVWSLELPDSEKIVLLALADCANDEGHCWPSMKTLAAKCSKTDRTVQASVKRLVDSGHLTRREVPGKGCNYTVHPRKDCTPEAASPRSDFRTPPKPVRDTPEAASDKPSLNHKEPSIDPIDLLQEAWNAKPARYGAIKSNKLEGERRRKARRFIGRYTEDQISDALDAVAFSKFLTGRTKEGFRADIKFLFSEEHMTRLLEGFYGESVSKIAA